MRIRSYHALTPPLQILWNAIRFLIPQRRRFFFEGHRKIPGQLWYAERKLLYETILETHPEVAFEVGTWRGGGSTLFIAQALANNATGELYTVEIDPERHDAAVHGYELHLPALRERIHFNLGHSTDVFPPLLSSVGRCDLLFLDGAQDAAQTLRELEMFDPYLPSGATLLMHDWDNEKMIQVRPLLESNPRFHIERVLTAPESVGFAVIRVVEVG